MQFGSAFPRHTYWPSDTDCIWRRLDACKHCIHSASVSSNPLFHHGLLIINNPLKQMSPVSAYVPGEGTTNAQRTRSPSFTRSTDVLGSGPVRSLRWVACNFQLVSCWTLDRVDFAVQPSHESIGTEHHCSTFCKSFYAFWRHRLQKQPQCDSYHYISSLPYDRDAALCLQTETPSPRCATGRFESYCIYSFLDPISLLVRNQWQI